MIDRLRLKPCDARSFRLLFVVISSRQSWRRLDSFRCASFRESMGALIKRWPPFRFGIWKVLYFSTSGCLYKMYARAFSLKPNKCAISLSEVAAFKVASLDIGQRVDSPVLLCDSHTDTDIDATMARETAYSLTFVSNATKHGTKSTGES